MLAPTACTHTVSGSISLPSPGFFSPFPHGTSSLSVNREYLALEDGPPIFSQNITCSDLLNMWSMPFRVRGYHPLWRHFPEPSTTTYTIGWSPFARRYSGSLVWFPFLRVLRCFSSPGSPPAPMYSVQDTLAGGFPHSEIHGSKLVYQLPMAYRRLLRLSSPSIAKASTVCA